MSTAAQSETKLPEKANRMRLRLYVAGSSPHSVEALANLRTICADQPGSPPGLEVVDALQEPERALRDGIVVTPTLVRLAPGPELRIFGTLSDPGRVRAALGLEARPPSGHA